MYTHTHTHTHTQTHTIDYYSAIKKSAIMPFVATWIDPEMIMLTEDMTYMWNLKYGTNDLIWVAKGDRSWGKDGVRIWSQQMQTSIYRMGKQQGFIV